MSGWGRRPWWHKRCPHREGGFGAPPSARQCVLELAHDDSINSEPNHIYEERDVWPLLPGFTGCRAPGCWRVLRPDGTHVWESNLRPVSA